MRSLVQVERPRRMLAQQPLEFGRTLRLRHPCEVDLLEVELPLFEHDLPRRCRRPRSNTVRSASWRSNDTVAALSRSAATSSSPRDPDRERRVIGELPGSSAVEEQQLLLLEGERAVGVRRRDPAHPAARLAPARGRPPPGADRQACGLRGPDAASRPRLGERAKRRLLEQRPDREVDRAPAANLRGDAGGEQRVAAEVEEVVLAPDPLDAEHRRHISAISSSVGVRGAAGARWPRCISQRGRRAAPCGRACRCGSAAAVRSP